MDQSKNLQNPNPQTLESDNKKDPNGAPTPAKPSKKTPKQTARKSTGGKPTSNSRSKGKEKPNKNTPKPKPKSKSSPKRSKPEVGETDDTPVKKQKRKKARKLSLSSEEKKSVELDVLPGEVPTHFSSRLAGENVRELELPRPVSRKEKANKTCEGKVLYGWSDKFVAQVFGKRPHPKPTLSQKYMMEYEADEIELKLIATQVTEPQKARKTNPTPFVLYGNLPPRKEILERAPTLISMGLTKEQLVEKVMLAQAKECDSLQQRVLLCQRQTTQFCTKRITSDQEP